jgi:hypothetical protein
MTDPIILTRPKATLVALTYATEFGSQVVEITIPGIMDYVKRFKVLSISEIKP